MRFKIRDVRGRARRDDARHVRAHRRPEPHERVLDDHALGARQVDFFSSQVVNQRIGLLASHVVARHDDVEPRQPLGADDGVDHLEEARFGRRGANTDGDVRRRDGLVDQSKNAGPI